MAKYKYLSLSERFEEIIENIKAYGSKTNPDSYKNFYNLFQETMKELNLTQSQLIALATDRKTRVDFTLAFMNIANLISKNGNHLLDNEKMAQKTAQNIAAFATELNNHLSKTDTQNKENKMQTSSLKKQELQITSIGSISINPELKTPEGLKKARENLEYRLSQEQQAQNYNYK